MQSPAENTRGVKTPVFICNLYFLNAQTRQRWYKIISKIHQYTKELYIMTQW